MSIYMSHEVADGLEACRQSGACNMFDRNCVQQWLNVHNYYAAVIWVEDNTSLYAELIMTGDIIPETFDELLTRITEDASAYPTLGDLYEKWGPINDEQRDKLGELSDSGVWTEVGPGDTQVRDTGTG